MLAYFSQLKNRRVVKNKDFLGKLQDVLIDLTTGVVKAVIVDDEAWDAGKIIKWDPLVVSADEHPIEGGIPQQDILSKQLVYTKTGDFIGLLIDYQIDTVQLAVTQIVVKPKRRMLSWFPRQRVFGFAQIYSISRSKIVVKEDLKTVKIKEEPAYTLAY